MKYDYSKKHNQGNDLHIDYYFENKVALTKIYREGNLVEESHYLPTRYGIYKQYRYDKKGKVIYYRDFREDDTYIVIEGNKESDRMTTTVFNLRNNKIVQQNYKKYKDGRIIEAGYLKNNKLHGKQIKLEEGIFRVAEYDQGNKVYKAAYKDQQELEYITNNFKRTKFYEGGRLIKKEVLVKGKTFVTEIYYDSKSHCREKILKINGDLIYKKVFNIKTLDSFVYFYRHADVKTYFKAADTKGFLLSPRLPETEWLRLQ